MLVRQTDVLTMSEGRRTRGTERRRDIFVETAMVARGDYKCVKKPYTLLDGLTHAHTHSCAVLPAYLDFRLTFCNSF